MQYILNENEYKKSIYNENAVKCLKDIIFNKYKTLEIIKYSQNNTLIQYAYDSSIDKINDFDLELLRAFNETRNSGFFSLVDKNKLED